MSGQSYISWITQLDHDDSLWYSLPIFSGFLFWGTWMFWGTWTFYFGIFLILYWYWGYVKFIKCCGTYSLEEFMYVGIIYSLNILICVSLFYL